MVPPTRTHDAAGPAPAAVPCGAPRNAFTVDLEEWFHICGVPQLARAYWDALPTRVELTTTRLLDLLDACQIRATFFVVGWIAERHPRLIEKVRDAGHEVGSHGYAHQRAYDLGRDGFAADLRDSLSCLRAVVGQPITAFRAPEWSINERSLWAFDALAEAGITRDASMAPVKLVGSVHFPRYPHSRPTSTAPVLEFPPLVTDRLGQVMPIGWGWALRMSSPRRVVTAIEHFNRQGWPAVLTVHPWEIDPEPPRVHLPPSLRFAHYFKLDGFAGRLAQILGTVRFDPLNALSSQSTAA